MGKRRVLAEYRNDEHARPSDRPTPPALTAFDIHTAFPNHAPTARVHARLLALVDEERRLARTSGTDPRGDAQSVEADPSPCEQRTHQAASAGAAPRSTASAGAPSRARRVFAYLTCFIVLSGAVVVLALALWRAGGIVRIHSALNSLPTLHWPVDS